MYDPPCGEEIATKRCAIKDNTPKLEAARLVRTRGRVVKESADKGQLIYPLKQPSPQLLGLVYLITNTNARDIGSVGVLACE